MRLLITGGAGFIGLHLAELACAAGHDVTLVDLRPAPRALAVWAPAARARVADIMDAGFAALVQDADAVVHCAGVVGPAPSLRDPRRTVAGNVQALQAVLEAARAAAVPVVAMSTATLYGRRPDLKPLAEDDRPDPVGLYDATKLMGEILCDAYRKSFGLRVASIRTSFVYGHGHSTGEYFVESALAGRPVVQESGAGHHCDFTYVVDLAAGLLAAAEHGALPEPVYNLSGGRLHTRAEFADAVRRHLPQADIRIGAGVNAALHLRGACDLARARRDLGYAPRYDLAAGIGDWIARERRLAGG